MTLVIGFGHKARHGKDTAGEAIKEYFDRRREAALRHNGVKGIVGHPIVKIYKWADSLYAEVNGFLTSSRGDSWKNRFTGVMLEKDIAIPEWVVPDPNPEVSKIAPYGKHPKLLQWWGTEYRRQNFGMNYWVERTVAQIKNEAPDIALVTDTRFPNEGDACKDLGGYTVKVTRLNSDGTEYVDPSRQADHPSEIAMNDYNWDFRLTIAHGHAALTAELAITLAEYLRGLRRK